MSNFSHSKIMSILSDLNWSKRSYMKDRELSFRTVFWTGHTDQKRVRIDHFHFEVNDFTDFFH